MGTMVTVSMIRSAICVHFHSGEPLGEFKQQVNHFQALESSTAGERWRRKEMFACRVFISAKRLPTAVDSAPQASSVRRRPSTRPVHLRKPCDSMAQ